MQNLSRFFIALVLTIFVGSVIWYVAESSRTTVVEVPKAHRETVAVTIFPLYDITRIIAKDTLNVELILPPGSSPHTFEASPTTLKTLADAQVIYAIGHGLDTWTNTLAQSQGVEVVTVDQGIAVRSHEEEDEHEEEEEDDHGETDPHYWLSIQNAIVIAQTITADLSMRFPELATTFEGNLITYLVELDNAQTQLQASLEGLENRSLVTFHDAWYYFAQAFSLNVVGSYEPTAGREPTPKYLADLTAGLAEAGTTTIYSEPQFGTANLTAFAQDNNLTIVELDPIGGTQGRDTYLDLMYYNVNVILQNN